VLADRTMLKTLEEQSIRALVAEMRARDIETLADIRGEVNRLQRDLSASPSAVAAQLDFLERRLRDITITNAAAAGDDDVAAVRRTVTAEDEMQEAAEVNEKKEWYSVIATVVASFFILAVQIVLFVLGGLCLDARGESATCFGGGIGVGITMIVLGVLLFFSVQTVSLRSAQQASDTAAFHEQRVHELKQSMARLRTQDMLNDAKIDSIFSSHVLNRLPVMMRTARTTMPITKVRQIKAAVIVGGAAVNVFAITSNWVSRPARDAAITYNLSQLIVFWTEFIVICGFAGVALRSALVRYQARFITGAWLHQISHYILVLGKFNLFRLSGKIKQTFGTLIDSFSLLNREFKTSFGGVSAVILHLFFYCIIAVGLPAAAFVVKLSQVAFVGEKVISEWTFSNWVALIGCK
jgi:hypothetical protein